MLLEVATNKFFALIYSEEKILIARCNGCIKKTDSMRVQPGF